MIVSIDQIKEQILEECSESANGSWELWWVVRSKFSNVDQKELRENFVAAIQQLIENNKLLSAKYGTNGEFPLEIFNPERLDYEVRQADSANGDEFYWFMMND